VQVWQWVRYQAALDDGRQVDRALVRAVLEDLVTSLRNELGESWGNRRFDLAAQLFEEMVFADELPEFLTSIAYEHIE
jgi:malate synthase